MRHEIDTYVSSTNVVSAFEPFSFPLNCGGGHFHAFFPRAPFQPLDLLGPLPVTNFQTGRDTRTASWMEVNEDVVARLERLDRERKEAVERRKIQEQLRFEASPRSWLAKTKVHVLTTVRLVRRPNTDHAGARRIPRNPSMRFGTNSTPRKPSSTRSSSGWTSRRALRPHVANWTV